MCIDASVSNRPSSAAATEGCAVGKAFAEIRVPCVEVGIEVHQRDLAESTVHGLQQRIGDGVVAADRDEAVDLMRPVRRAEQLAGAALDRGQRLGDGVRVAGDVAGVGELQIGERLHVELRVILRPDRSRCLPYRHRSESGTGTETDTTVERGTEDGDVASVDIA